MDRTQNWLRLVFAVIFVIGAAANANRVTSTPEIYRDFASVSFLPIYRYLWSAYVFPNIQIFVGIVVALELSIALLLLGKGCWPIIGMRMAAAFMLFLVPFWWFGGSLINLVFALVFLWMQRSVYPDNIFVLFRPAEEDS